VNPRDRPAQRFLVEWYDSVLTAAPLQQTSDRLRASAAAVSTDGVLVGVELTLAAPTDDVLYSVFSAESADAVLRACEHAGCPPDRITTGVSTHLNTL
jgi:hypothetical protein